MGWGWLLALLLTQCSHPEIVTQPVEPKPPAVVLQPPPPRAYIDPKEESEIERSPETYFFGPNRARQEHEEDVAEASPGVTHPARTRARRKRTHHHRQNHMHENRGRVKKVSAR